MNYKEALKEIENRLQMQDMCMMIFRYLQRNAKSRYQ